MSAHFHNLYVKKSLKLCVDSEVLRKGFLALSNTADLAALLDCSTQQLTYWCQIATSVQRYRVFEIAKRSGDKRTIEAPLPVLHVLQHKLLQVLEGAYAPRAPVHGFVKGRSILTNAAQHVRRAWVLNIDLKDFFHSIHFGRVRGIFRAKPFLLPDPVAIAIAQLTCSRQPNQEGERSRSARLPQGAPTSPIISNIVCAKMDGELRRLAHEHGAIYTRYADDITFSVRRRGFPQAIATMSEPEEGVVATTLSDALVAIIEGNGFGVNKSKVRIQSWKRSQRVTGLVVNQRPNVPRRFVRRTRAMLHAWERYGLDAAGRVFLERYAGECKNKACTPSFKKRVRGNIAYIGQIRGRDDAVYRRLLFKYHMLIGNPLPGVPVAMTTNITRRDVFICHASEDKKAVVEPLVAALERAGVSVWYDKANIGWGDSLTGKINEGLASSRYVMVVISASFMAKNWPQRELGSALSREINSGKTSVLPLMVGSDEEIRSFQSSLPLQADKLHLRWSSDPAPLVSELRKLLGPT